MRVLSDPFPLHVTCTVFILAPCQQVFMRAATLLYFLEVGRICVLRRWLIYMRVHAAYGSKKRSVRDCAIFQCKFHYATLLCAEIGLRR